MDMPVLEMKTVAILPQGCFSVLLWKDVPFAVALERTFADGRPVIGNGIYDCVRSYYHKGNYATYEIKVAGHDHVLFHKGNLETDSLACVLVGECFGMLNGTAAILQSGAGFAELMDKAKSFTEFQMLVTGR